VDARVTRAFRVQAGVSSGRTSTDNCEIVAKLPELIATDTTALPSEYCHVDSPFLTQAKAMGSYTIPRVEVQISGAFQSNPGPLAQICMATASTRSISGSARSSDSASAARR
jgi:hypothetical protein